MIIDDIKKRALEAMKAKDSVATTILRLAQGEIQQSEARAGKTFTDEESAAVVKKLVKSNRETAEQTTDEAAKAILVREIELLEQFLPKELDAEAVLAALPADVADAIRAAANPGMGTGLAMKFLKGAGIAAPGSAVNAAVAKIRG
jgi:uncharacterized protein YqeY